MPNLTKFNGNYLEVAGALEIPKIYYPPTKDMQTYAEDVGKDLNRIPYVSYKRDITELKSKLADTSHLENKELNYSQGNFTGLFFPDFYLQSQGLHQSLIESAVNEGTYDNDLMGDISFAYEDDDGNMCALSIKYVRADPSEEEQPIPVEQRERNFIIAVIKNTNYAPEDRTVTVIAHNRFLSDGIRAKGKDIETQEVYQDVSEALNSKHISALIPEILAGDTVSIPHFKELDARITVNNNIDYRDQKLRQIRDIIEFAQSQLPEDDELKQYLAQLETRSQQEIDFFKAEIYLSNLKPVYEKIEPHIKQQHAKLIEFVEKLNKLEVKLAEGTNDYLLKAIREKKKQIDGIATELSGIVENLNDYNLVKDMAPVIAAIEYQDKDFIPLVKDIFNAAKEKETKPLSDQLDRDKKAVVPQEPKNYKRNFFQRHKAAILAGIGAVLACVSLALVLSGVGAPLGIALAVGTPTILGIAGAAIAGGVAVGAGALVVAKEKQFSHSENQYISDLGQVESKQKTIQGNYDEKIVQFEETHKRIVDGLEQVIQEIDRGDVAPPELVAPEPEPVDEFSELLAELGQGLEQGEAAVIDANNLQMPGQAAAEQLHRPVTPAVEPAAPEENFDSTNRLSGGS